MRYRTPEAARTHQALLVAEAVAALRHDLRTRIGSIRNAAFFLRRKVESGAPALWTADARVPGFFELIDQEVVAGEQALASRATALLPDSPARDRVDVAAMIRALAEAPPTVALALPGPEALWVEVAADEIDVGVGCLLDNAIEAALAAGGGSIRAGCARRADGGVTIEIVDDAGGFAGDAPEAWLAPFASSRPGRLGLGLNVARRVAERAGGHLELQAAGRGARAALLLPAA